MRTVRIRMRRMTQRDGKHRGADASEPNRIPSTPPRKASSHELLGDRSELLIEHQGAEYRLRITRLGKLILTK